jgi:hypothetical protein
VGDSKTSYGLGWLFLILTEAVKCFSQRDLEESSILGFLCISPSPMANYYLIIPHSRTRDPEIF